MVGAEHRVDLMKPPLKWSKEQLNDTPSIKDGISEADERIERYLSCQIVRDLIRDVFKSKDGDSYDVQILGCYYLQIFFMFQSMKNFDTRGAVAIAAARLACKMYDEKPRGGTMYLELDRQRTLRGQKGMSEQEKKDMKQQACEIEIFLLRLTKFETDIALPCDEIDSLVEKALVMLSHSSDTFKKQCGEKSPVAEANALRSRVTHSSKQFLSDGFMGLLPLRFSRRCASWSAILFALRYAVRSIPMRELVGIMVQASGDDGIDNAMIEAGFQEIIGVFKAKPQAERKAKAPAPAATVKSMPSLEVAESAPSPAAAPAIAVVASLPVLSESTFRVLQRERSRSRDRQRT